MRLLDLFCGGGGAAVGYAKAGFEVVGVDIATQPSYPYEKYELTDAMTFPLEGFDAFHASPPCQDHSVLRSRTQVEHGTGWMLEGTIRRLQATNKPWVVENVEGAKFPPDLFVMRLCGSSFGLRVQRHRLFASNVFLQGRSCEHKAQRRSGPVLGVYGHGGTWKRTAPGGGGMKVSGQAAADALGVTHTTNQAVLSQAIPPAYTEWIGGQLLEHLGVK